MLNPLQTLIREQLDMQQLSQRGAAARSQGLITAATINRILKGHHHLVTSRAVAGLALALGLPEAAVAEAARATAFPAQWEEISKQFGGLSPERQEAVMTLLIEHLDQQEKERAAQLEKERPYRKRRTGRSAV